MGRARTLGSIAVVGGLALLASMAALTTPSAQAGSPPTFVDVPADHPFHTEITWVAEQGIATGYTGGRFKPDDPVTRQAMASFLHRFAGEPEPAPEAPTFVDVGEAHPFRTAISWLAGSGITTGYEDGTFRPGAPVTRQSTAAFLFRFAEQPDVPADPPSFTDVSVEHPFHPEISWLASTGITTGYADGTFRPGAVVTRQAMAAFLFRFDQLPDPPDPPDLELGNPEPLLGSDPMLPTPADTENLWLNVGSRGATKVSGDRYTNGVCGNGAGGTPATGCTAGAGYTNAEYAEEGHLFRVRVDEVTSSQPLRIQVYDPAYTYQGDFCENNAVANSGSRLISTLVGLSESTMNDGVNRYAPGQTRYCAGDQNINGHQVNTTYVVRAPDATPEDPLDNPVVASCARTFTGRNASSNELWDRLAETAAYDQVNEWGFEQAPFRQHFRQWFTLCEIAQPIIGEYLVQVVPNTTADDRLHSDPESTAGGHNRFALRAGFGGMAVPNNTGAALPDGTGVQVEPIDHLVTSNNGPDDEVVRYLARIDEVWAGRTIGFELFDLGDVGSGSVSVQVLPPLESNVAAFADCTGTRDGPAFTVVVSDCQVANMTSVSYQGRTLSLEVPIPADYTCDGDVHDGCWLRLAFTYSGGATPTETASITPYLPDPAPEP